MTLAADARPPLVSEEALAQALLAYALPDGAILRFLRRGYNDHYLVTAGSERYVFRVYLNNKPYLRDANDFLGEVDALAGLKAAGVSVSAAIARRDGTLLGQVGAGQETRYAALFEFAQGSEVSGQDLTEDEARHLGVTIATLHLRADEAQIGQNRPMLDEAFLIDDPVAALRRMLGERADFLEQYGEGLKQKLAALPQEVRTLGFIHGDLHLGNVHFGGEQGCVLFDFDHAGLGWRAYDLATLQVDLDELRWSALLGGYQTVRPLAQSELASLPLFAEIRHLWNPGDWFAMSETGAWGQEDEEEEAKAGLLARLRVQADAVLE